MKKLIVSFLLIGLLACPSLAVLARGSATGWIINNTQGVAAQEFPNIIADGAGNTIVAWHDYKSGAAALYAQSYDSNGAARWSPAAGVPICTVTNFFGTMIALDSNALAFHMVSDGSGGAILAWNDYRTDGTTSHLYAQRINGSGVVQWTANGKFVCDAVVGQNLTSMIADGSGGAILAWEDMRNMVNGSDIYAQKIDSGGASQWTLNGLQITDNTALGVGSSRPQLCSNGAGGAFVTWDDNRANASYAGVYAQKISANGGVGWAANGVAVQVNAAGNCYKPKIVEDGASGAIITWWDERNAPGAFQYDVFTQRMNTSGEKVWTTQGVTLCLQSDYSDNSVDLAVVSDGSNGAIVSWPDLRNVMAGVRIYAQRVVANGGVSWTADGVLVNSISGNSSYSLPRMVADGSGGCYIATANLELVGSTQDIRLHHLDSSGAVPVPWTDGKVVATSTTQDEMNPRLAYDSINGQVVTVWKHKVNDTRGDIWAKSYTSGGVSPWGGEKIAATGAATQRYPAVASDGAGGGVVVWEDARSVDYYQIYSQRFNSSGSVLWTADGVRLDATAQDNLRPSICRSSDGYYIAAWTNGSGIYVQKVDENGAAQWAAEGVNIAGSFGVGFYYPVVASDGAGGAIVAYSSGTGGAVTKTSARLGTQLWASAYLSDLSDEELPDLNGILLAKNGGGGGAGTFRIYFKRVASDGSIVTPYGGAVQDATTLGVLATTYHDAVNGEIQLWPTIAKVDADNVVIAWDDKRTIILTNYWSIFAQKVRISDGARQWTDDAKLVALPGGAAVAFYPWVGSNGTDGTGVVTWMQSATSGVGYNYDILAYKLNSAGESGWVSGIYVANDASLDEIRPKVAVDSSGNSFFVWQEGTWTGAQNLNATTLHPDAPTMSNGAIYSQLVDSSGTLQGTKFQVSSAAVNLNYEAPDVAFIDTGTAGVVYDTDIFAQSVSGVVVAVAPTAPTGFSGTAQSTSSILWSWTDNANNETGFKLVDPANNSTLATIATANTTSYTETGLSANTSYTRAVLAYNSAGNSSVSNSSTVSTLASTTYQSPTIGGAKHGQTNLAIASGDNISSAGNFKFNITDPNSDGQISHTKVEILDASGKVIRTMESNEVLSQYTLSEPLPAGTYTVRATATSIRGTTSVKEWTGLKVSDKLEMPQAPVVYPLAITQSSIKAQGAAATQVAYQLSKDGNVSMVIYSVDGQIVYRGDYVAGTNGGSAGPNAVSWDGYTTRGVPVGRGLLLVQFFDRDSKQNLGKAVIHVQ